MKKVWAIEQDWADDDELNGHSISLYEDEEKARYVFNNLVKESKTENWGGVINNDGLVADGYCLEESPNSFSIYEDGFYSSNHEEIKLVQLDLN